MSSKESTKNCTNLDVEEQIIKYSWNIRQVFFQQMFVTCGIIVIAVAFVFLSYGPSPELNELNTNALMSMPIGAQVFFVLIFIWGFIFSIMSSMYLFFLVVNVYRKDKYFLYSTRDMTRVLDSTGREFRLGVNPAGRIFRSTNGGGTIVFKEVNSRIESESRKHDAFLRLSSVFFSFMLMSRIHGSALIFPASFLFEGREALRVYGNLTLARRSS